MAAIAAASPATAEEAAVRQARRHMEEGQEYFLQERWEDAATSFMTAYELRPHRAFLYNAALAYHRLGSAQEAVDLYVRYLEEAPGSADRAEVEENVRLLRRAIAAAPTAPPPCTGADCPATPTDCAEDDVDCQLAAGERPAETEVRITLDPEAVAAAASAEMKSIIFVEVEPADATIVLIDEAGEEVHRGTSPLEHTADAGRYTLAFEHPAYRPIRTPIQINSGRYYVFLIEMSQPPAFLQVTANVPGSTVYLDDRAAGPVGTTPWGNVVASGAHRVWVERPGYAPIEREIEIGLGQEQEVSADLERLDFGMVRVLTNVEPATVEIDGEEVGTAPYFERLEPGPHTLRVTARRMKEYEADFTVERGQTTRVLVRLNPRPSRTSAWVSLTFSALTFAAAGIVGWYSTTIFDDLERDARAGRLATDDERVNAGFIYALGADIGFGLGTIIGALTLYYFLRDPLPDSEGRVEDPVDFTENPVTPGEGALAPPPRAPTAAPATVRAAPPAQPAAGAEPAGAPAATPIGDAPADAPAGDAPADAPAGDAPAADEGLAPQSSLGRRLERRARAEAVGTSRLRLGLGPGLVLHF
jgi:hypothetical protein